VRLAASFASTGDDQPGADARVFQGYRSIIPNNFEFFGSRLRQFSPGDAKETLDRRRLPERLRRGDYYSMLRTRTRRGRPEQSPSIGYGQLRPLERAAFFKDLRRQEAQNIIQGASGAFGNAAPARGFVITDGTYVYGSYPGLDGLFREQAADMDYKRREATLHKIQQLVQEKVVYAPSGNSRSSMGWDHGWENRVLG